MIKNRVELDQKINNIENNLSKIAAIPLVGTLAGGAKVCLGAAQSFTALAITIITAIPASRTGDWSTTSYAWSHVKHGLGNIIAGTLEAIPVVGSILWVYRDNASHFEAKGRFYISTGHADKFMPYESLVKRDLSVEHNEMHGRVPLEAILDCEKSREKFDEKPYTLEDLKSAARDYINTLNEQYPLDSRSDPLPSMRAPEAAPV